MNKMNTCKHKNNDSIPVRVTKKLLNLRIEELFRVSVRGIEQDGRLREIPGLASHTLRPCKCSHFPNKSFPLKYGKPDHFLL